MPGKFRLTYCYLSVNWLAQLLTAVCVHYEAHLCSEAAGRSHQETPSEERAVQRTCLHIGCDTGMDRFCQNYGDKLRKHTRLAVGF